MSLLSFITGGSGGVEVAQVEGAEKLKLQLVSSEQHQWEVELTENAVEDGAPVTDHAKAKPDMLVVEGLFSDAPISLIDLASMTFEGGSRIANAISFFRGLRDSRTVIKITTGYQVYESMMCVGVTLTKSSQAGKSLPIKVSFKEIRFVGTETVDAFDIAKGIASKAKNLGKQATSTPTEAVNDGSLGSILSRWTGVGG